jgi:hypothetical protein
MKVRLTALVASVVLLSGTGGCRQRAQSVEFESAPPTTILTTHPHALPPLIVRDAEGKKLEPQPELEISVSPASVLLVQNHQLTAIGNGEATVSVAIPDTAIMLKHRLSVRIVDKIDVRCPLESCRFRVGDEIGLRAEVFSRSSPVDGAQVDWQVQPAGIMDMIEPARFKARAAGSVVVKARVGEAETRREIFISAPVDRIRIICPEGHFKKGLEPGDTSCQLEQGKRLRLEASASGASHAVHDVDVSWSTSNSSVALIDDSGGLQGVGPGLAEVTARVGLVSDKMRIEVLKGCVGNSHIIAIDIRMAGYFDQILASCTDSAAGHCINERGEKGGTLEDVLAACCCKRVEER